MSDQQPSFGPPQGPPPGPPPGTGLRPQPGPRGRRKWLIGGGAVVAAAALVGGGSFAAVSLLGGGEGPEPAEALPASTFAYASVDLSHLGDAFTMLAKFPAVTKDADLGDLTKGGGDPREKIVKAILDDEGGDFCGGLTWDAEFEPWLGQRAAVAGVEVDDAPVPVVAVEVKDAKAAQAAFDKFNGCSDDSDQAAYSIAGDWALLGQDQATINKVAKDAADSSLADDGDYQDWTGQIGDPGVVTLYAAPSAGDLIAQELKDHPDVLGDLTEEGSASSDDFGWYAETPDGSGYDESLTGSDDLFGFCPGLLDNAGGMADTYEKYLADFGGAAATLRFSDGGVEVESAADFGRTTSASDEAGSLVESLPDDTAVAAGASVGDDWFDTAMGSLGEVCGDGFDADSLEDQLSQMTGLDLPTDLDTLLGDGVAISLSGDFDPRNLDDPSDAPVALKVKGDPDAIEKVVGKISDRLGGTGVLGTDKDGDEIAIGPNESYRKAVLGDGGLGGDSTFKNVVPDADKASAILYVNFNAFDDLAASDQEVAENYKVLDGLGISAWYDGTTQHAFARLSTD